MKKIILTSVVIIASALFVQAQESVPSKNVVGYVNVDVPPTGGFNLVSHNFRAVGGGDMLMSEVFGTNSLVKAGFPTLATQVYLWDPIGQTYKAYFQKTDDLFYDSLNPFGASEDPAMPSGTVFWLQSHAGQAAVNTITLMGEAVGTDDASQSLAGAAGGAYNFLQNAFAADLDITDNNWLADGATGAGFPTLADQVFIWNGTGYDAHFLTAAGTWKNSLDPFGADTAPFVPVGVGAFYQAQAGYTATIQRPYTYPVD